MEDESTALVKERTFVVSGLNRSQNALWIKKFTIKNESQKGKDRNQTKYEQEENKRKQKKKKKKKKKRINRSRK
jgi:hypothetical protein